MVRVLIADDQPMVRTCLRVILEAEPDIEVVGEAGDGAEAVREARRLRPEVVLMDVRMPGVDGIEATRRLVAERATNPVEVLVLTTFDVDKLVEEALRAGAVGYLLKDAATEQLVRAVRLCAKGQSLLAPSVTRRLIDRLAAPRPSVPGTGLLDELTAREREVLVLLARGLSNAEIATSLHVGQTTVKSHVGHLLAKLGVRDRVQAVVLAYEHGLVAPGTASHAAAS